MCEEFETRIMKHNDNCKVMTKLYL